MKRKTSS